MGVISPEQVYDHIVLSGEPFEALCEAFEKLDDPDGLTSRELVAAFAFRDRFDAWLTAAVGAFDRDETYVHDGAATMTAWIAERCRHTSTDAKRVSETARKLRSLPHLAVGWRDGTISTGHVRAVCAIVPNRHLEAFAEAEAVMATAFAVLSVREATSVLRDWVAAADDADPEPEPNEPDDELTIAEMLDGRRVITGRLGADSAVEVEQALGHAGTDDVTKTLGERRAEALVEVCRFYNNHNDKAGARRHRPHLTVIINEGRDGQPTGETLGGTPVSRTTLRRWFCDSTISRMMTSGSHLLDYGTAVTTIPLPLWRAVAIRDRHCRFPGCDRPVSWCEAHHIVPCEHHGPTVITNLALFCSKHHHLLHSPGWSAAMDPDGTVRITAPDGITRTTRPQGLHNTLWPPGPDPG